MVAAITAGDPAGIAMAYDRYAAALYGYCHWMLHDSAEAAESLQDTFVLAATTLSGLPEPSKLRPWLFALARNECRRRIRPGSVTRDEADAANQRADGGQRADEVGRPADATVQFRTVSEPIHGPADATVVFPVISEPTDATVVFPVVSEPIHEPADATMPFRMVSQLADATMQFRVVSEPTDATDGLADVPGYLGQAELRALIRSILADLKPREREVIELSFRHDLDDKDLAIALGVSWSRAHALASRARGRLEELFGALRIALAGREACPVVEELLADWDGQLTEQTQRPGRLAHRAVPDLRQSRAGGAAPDGSFRPAAAGPAPSGTAGAGLEPLLLHGRGCGGLPPTGGPARGIDMVGNILAGDQAGEVGQHPGQSGSGDRHHGCRGVGGGGRECHATHLRWLPRRRCPGASANRRDLREPSCGRPGLGDRPRIRQGEAFPGRQSASDPRPVPGPTVAVVVVILARTVTLAPGVVLAVELAQAVEIALALAFDVALARVIPVGDALMRTGLTWAAS